MKVPLVEMESINKWFGKVQALKNVNFKIYPGEVVSIVGDNGAGKSTLINILSGVVPLDTGKMKYNGKEVKIKGVKDARKLGIETVYQNQALIPYFSVARNIFVGRELTKRMGPVRIMDFAGMREESQKVTTRLRLKIPSMGQEVQYCSGGEAQGVTIARALYFKAKLVILDEPTTALSVEGVKQLFNFVRELKGEGIACILISHRIDQIYPVTDRFVFLLRGIKVHEAYKKDISEPEVEAFLTRGWKETAAR